MIQNKTYKYDEHRSRENSSYWVNQTRRLGGNSKWMCTIGCVDLVAGLEVHKLWDQMCVSFYVRLILACHDELWKHISVSGVSLLICCLLIRMAFSSFSIMAYRAVVWCRMNGMNGIELAMFIGKIRAIKSFTAASFRCPISLQKIIMCPLVVRWARRCFSPTIFFA